MKFFKKKERAPEFMDTCQHVIPAVANRGLPADITGPTVDADFWASRVSPAGKGPIETGCELAIREMRAYPGAYRLIR